MRISNVQLGRFEAVTLLNRLPRVLVSSFVFLISMCLVRPEPFRADDWVYERDIAPILRTHCAGCHQDAEAEGEFSVETFSTLQLGGESKGAPILPGNPDDSFLIKSIEGRARPHMPPKEEPRVRDQDIAVLRRWIADGAPGPAVDISIMQMRVAPKQKLGLTLEAPRPVTAAAYSPDGRHLAMGRFGFVEVRELELGSTRHVFRGIEGKINSLSFSPDGSRLAVGTGFPGISGEARLFDMETGASGPSLSGHRDILYATVFSPDGRLIATAGYDRIIRLWDVDSARVLHTIEGHEGAVFALAFDPSGSVLASASADTTVKLWRVRDGRRLDTLNQPQGEQHSVVFTPDGEHILSAGADRRIHMWRFVSKEEPAINPVVHSRFAHGAPIRLISLIPDGTRLVSAGADRTMKLWRLPELIEEHAYEPLSDVANTILVRPGTDRFLVATMDGAVNGYDVIEIGDRSGAGGVGTDGKGTERPVAKVARANSTVKRETIPRDEMEPNDTLTSAPLVEWPAEITGSIQREGDQDLYRFHAMAGQELTLIIDAARSKSKLDSRLEILWEDGTPVEQVVLQAVRDSWFTFRGKDAFTSDDFRVHNWMEMELDEYLYANGEVVKLWLYPRGPDSGFKVYPGSGTRFTYFSTTPLAHALGEPCYIVVPFPAGTEPIPNGLPVYRLNYENDDDPYRRWGADSLLLFTAPKDGHYLVRVTDVRGMGASDGYQYKLTIRETVPDFQMAMQGKDPKVSPGSGREITFAVGPYEGFNEPVQIEIENMPEGFHIAAPIEIEAGQLRAVAVIYADSDAKSPSEEEWKRVRVTARADIGGEVRTRDMGNLGAIQVGEPALVTVEILPTVDQVAAGLADAGEGGPLEFLIRPGETIRARVRAVRNGFDGRIELGGDDSGRNLPHGLYVDNIGLNGLLIVEGQSEREFFITAAPKAVAGERWFHLRTTADGTQASRPVRIRVLSAADPEAE